MKAIAVKLTVEVQFIAADEAEVERIAKRHVDYLGIVTRSNPWGLNEDKVLADSDGKVVRLQTKTIDSGGFDD